VAVEVNGGLMDPGSRRGHKSIRLKSRNVSSTIAEPSYHRPRPHPGGVRAEPSAMEQKVTTAARRSQADRHRRVRLAEFWGRRIPRI